MGSKPPYSKCKHTVMDALIVVAIIIIIAIAVYVWRGCEREHFGEASPYKSKVVLITGSTRGIGYALAEHVLDAGAVVVINGRTSESVAKASKALQKVYGEEQVSGFVADVADASACKRLVAHAVKAHGRVDILVNNAALVTPGSMLTLDEEAWATEMATNVSGAFYLSRLALLSGGHVTVVNVGSGAAAMSGEQARAAEVPGSYVVSKTALAKLTEVLGAEAAAGAVVTCLEIDGRVATDLTSNLAPSLKMTDVLKSFDRLLEMKAEANGKVLTTSALLSSISHWSDRAAAIELSHGIQEIMDSVDPSALRNNLVPLNGENPFAHSSAPTNEYPSKNDEVRLITKLADISGVKPAQICVFPGTLIAVEAAAANAILYAVPGWSYFEHHMRNKGHTLLGVPTTVTDDGTALLKKMAQRIKGGNIGTVYLTSPQYPSGVSLDAAAVAAFLKAVPVTTVVVIDQCYLEYAPPGAFDASKYVNQYPNLVVTRSLSKFYGLASLRIAYTISGALMAVALAQQQVNPFLSSHAVDAALATLNDTEFHARVYAFNDAQRRRTRVALPDSVSSDANFVLAKVSKSLADITERLRVAGYASQQSSLYFDDYYFITLQSKKAIAEQIKALVN